MSPLLYTPPAWKCRNGRLTEEKPFHLVTTEVCTARSYRNTIKMILLPSHITCCAGFYINVLRIKNSMLQSYNKHIHTACHGQAMDRPRSTSCETYQHSSDVKEHKAKITHSTYSINSILKRGFAKRTCALISK